MRKSFIKLTSIIIALPMVQITDAKAFTDRTLPNPKYAAQILIDTAGGGGTEGATLPSMRWWFDSTPNGSPFIFWTWSPTD